MKDFFNYVLRFLVRVALHLYYKKIYVEGSENIPKNVPVILVANHQNALIDPLLLATHTRLNPYFLTRASVFKKAMVAKLLNFIRMLPVYRVRDGFSSIQKNEQTFDQTFEVLKNNGTVIIFAEGSHSLERNLRPLSKGFTRMAFGLKDRYPNLTPVILPVGINFSAHRRSGSLVRIIFGNPIPADMPNSKSGLLTKSVQESLRELIVEIPTENYDQNLQELLDQQVDLSTPKEVENYYETGVVTNPVRSVNTMANRLMKIYHFPLFLLWLWIKPKVEDTVFYSTFKFLIGFCFALLWYAVLIVLSLYSPLGSWGLAILFLGWVSLWTNQNNQE
ncbi:1-acyl-sn-glycerol-3-phosphate acyltransferase [Algoriphagus namhaensis]|uniref:1-acyl-sn-glycerol-3-phosphate acyltransferase n=1 Tax=Algoriphagus namhaensis TaxID=915353 RepID=A0ABV8ATP9_9BACT